MRLRCDPHRFRLHSRYKYVFKLNRYYVDFLKSCILSTRSFGAASALSLSRNARIAPSLRSEISSKTASHKVCI